MKSVYTITYERNDLKDKYKNLPFSEIKYDMLSVYDSGITFNEDIALFINDDGSVKIIKNNIKL